MATVKLPLDEMTVEEKLRLIDVIWADLETNHADIPVPKWQEEELRRRERQIADGSATFSPLEDVMTRLRARDI